MKLIEWMEKEVQPADAVTYDETGNYYRYFLPAYSVELLTLTK